MEKIKMQIVKLRKGNGLTQQQLADQLGVSFQTISKWENGISLPDISMLPYISECFKVSVDEILGLKPLTWEAYESKGTSQSAYWNDKKDYLYQTRSLMWNDDYLKFLVENVWKINRPVNLLDFGCGYGYLGLKIMPLLPEGSSYTGIDINEAMIDEAKRVFNEYDFQSDFIIGDVNTASIVQKYDIALCQSFLRHLPNPQDVLEKMIASVVEGGLIACIEVNRTFENDGLCINGLKLNASEQTSILQKIWTSEFEKEGRDYQIGMKIPFYMRKLGLRNIESRINDRVNYMSPEHPSYERQVSAFLSSAGLESPKSEDEIQHVIGLLMNRGISRTEAEFYLKEKESISAHLLKENGQSEIVQTFGLLITYG